ncbi:MAG: hypothetical protein COA99_08990 [Moraxellaceae bacterium]|nr:MAG: hypothetical protein COA99_08990 [Moraxellaceae bacterium]
MVDIKKLNPMNGFDVSVSFSVLVVGFVLFFSNPQELSASEFRKCGFEVRIVGGNLADTKVLGSEFIAWGRVGLTTNNARLANRYVQNYASACVRHAFSNVDYDSVSGACKFNPKVHDSDALSDGGVSGFKLTKARSALKETICKSYAGQRVGQNETLTIPGFKAYIKKTSGNGHCPSADFIGPMSLRLQCDSSVANAEKKDESQPWYHISKRNISIDDHGSSSLINAGGSCLSISLRDYNMRKNGGRIAMGDCNDLINQKWTMNPNKEIRTPNNMCLEVSHNAPKGVRLWQCNGSINQRWSYADRQLKDGEGKCLSINARGNDLRRYDSKLELKACDNTPKQQWVFDPALVDNSNELEMLTYTGISLINGAGNCLDVHHDDYVRATNGGKVQGWQCLGNVNQKWVMTSANELKSPNGLCLDVHAADYDSGKNAAKVQLWSCNGQQNQKWTYSNKKLRSSNGKCLAIYSGTMRENASKIQLWDCNSRVLQEWLLASDFSPLVSNGGALCLDVHAPDFRKNGGKVQIWGCNNQAQQKWRFTKDGTLQNAGGMCLDVHSSDYDEEKNGAKVQVWKCNGNANQKWTRQGKQIISSNDMCLDVSVSQMLQNGGKVQLWQCNNSAQQTW